jgi:hypothetical protein
MKKGLNFFATEVTEATEEFTFKNQQEQKSPCLGVSASVFSRSPHLASTPSPDRPL